MLTVIRMDEGLSTEARVIHGDMFLIRCLTGGQAISLFILSLHAHGS